MEVSKDIKSLNPRPRISLYCEQGKYRSSALCCGGDVRDTSQTGFIDSCMLATRRTCDLVMATSAD